MANYGVLVSALTIPRIAAAAEDTVMFRTGRKCMTALNKKGSRPW